MDKSSLLTALQNGNLDLQGQFLHGSNYTYLAQLSYADARFKVVYKPTRGEQPLCDFPSATLAKREVAAFLMSEALGWDLVPPTVYRRKGPMGPGSVQQYIEHDPNYHYFNFNEEDKQCLRSSVAFDLIINNADRKGSHVIIDDNRHIWLIDHGVCFHRDEKLRTVIWDFAGETIPLDLVDCTRRLLPQLQPESTFVDNLLVYLKPGEVRALANRTRQLLKEGVFPLPPDDRRVYPWPPV